jgi:WhiB family redox-sensing transcriptional regulator
MTSTREWREIAACRDVDPELFFGIKDSPVATSPFARERKAIAVCNRCPVHRQCLDWAISAGEVKHGVIGGLRAAERAALRRSDRQAA